MGGTRYSDAAYFSRMADHKSKGTDVFTHDDDIRSGRAAATVHDLLDPKKANKAGKIIRESLDSPAAPNSRAIAVLFDNTGSMSAVPRIFLTKLDKLMTGLVKKGFVADPHIMFGAINDATCSNNPLQLGQFEGGNEMDEALSKIFLEGGGGGHITESYELALYFLARHTVLDCVTKRGQKGYLFMLGDELPYPVVSASQVKRFIGDDIQADIPLADIINEVREKFEIFWAIPAMTDHFNDHRVTDELQKMFGQSFMKLTNPEDVCELIISTIGVTEGYDLHSVTSALKDIGADADSVTRATKAVAVYAKSCNSVAKAKVTGGALEESTGKDAVASL